MESVTESEIFIEGMDFLAGKILNNMEKENVEILDLSELQDKIEDLMIEYNRTKDRVEKRRIKAEYHTYTLKYNTLTGSKVYKELIE